MLFVVNSLIFGPMYNFSDFYARAIPFGTPSKKVLSRGKYLMLV